MSLLYIIVSLPLVLGFIDSLSYRNGLATCIGNFITATTLTIMCILGMNEQVYLLSITNTFKIIIIVTVWLVFAISIFSISYMKYDYRRGWFWFFIGLFNTSILLVILSSNALSLIMGWCGIEICSYALIGHWYRDEVEKWVGEEHVYRGIKYAWPPTRASLRALLTTEVGVITLLLACSLMYIYTGSFNINDWLSVKSNILTILASLLFIISALAISAQFPFTEWLFTAMTGPLPVSALIHSATLVNAGIYLLLKVSKLLVIIDHVVPLHYVLITLGLLTAMLSSVYALVSREFKVILASSTASYLGLMFTCIGMYLKFPEELVLNALILLLTAHALAKANLFLSGGYLAKYSASRFIDEFKVLLRFRTAYPIFIASTLTLLGIIPFNLGYIAKELMYHVSPIEVKIMISILCALTAIYMIRILTYFIRNYFEGRVITELKMEYLLMELPCLALAIIPYVSGILLKCEVVFEYTLVLVTLIAVLVYLINYKYRLVRVHDKLTYFIKLRYGLPVIYDKTIPNVILNFVKILWKVEEKLNNVMKINVLIFKMCYLNEKLEKYLNKILHADLVLYLKKFSVTLNKVHRAIVNNYIVILTLGLIVLITLAIMVM